jgi:uncharacterized membrane protein YfcA
MAGKRPNGQIPGRILERASAMASIGVSLGVLLGAVFPAVLATSFLSGIFGMVGGLILMGILLALLPVPLAMSLHAVTQMASNGWRAFLWRAHVKWAVLPGYLLGAAAAFALLSWIALAPPAALVYCALGLMPFAAAALPRSWALDIQRKGAPGLVGFLVMGLSVIAGVSGSMLDVFFVRTALDRRTIVATKATLQAIGHSLKFAYFSLVIGADTDDPGLPLAVYGAAVATAFIGTSSARVVLDRLTDQAFLRWSRRLVLGVGTAYLGHGLWLAFG